MAVVPYSVVEQGTSLDFRGVYRVAWRNVQVGDTCAPVALARYTDRSIQVSGDFSGATVDVTGTLDTVYVNLRDGEGQNLTNINDERIKYIQEPTAYLQPTITGGDVDTDITITVMCTRSAS
jgi:hypothetical protein